jgi:hypothetical protein
MPGPDEVKTKATKRISGGDYWLLHNKLEELDKAREEYQEWLHKEARENQVYADQIENVKTGRAREDDGGGAITCPKCAINFWIGGTIKRLDDEFIKKATSRFNDVIQKDKDVQDTLVALAKKHHTWPDLINPKTGEINDEDVEAIEDPEKNKNDASES